MPQNGIKAALLSASGGEMLLLGVVRNCFNRQKSKHPFRRNGKGGLRHMLVLNFYKPVKAK